MGLFKGIIIMQCSKERKRRREKQRCFNAAAAAASAASFAFVVYKNLTSAPFMISENSKLVQERQPGSNNCKSEGCNGTNINIFQSKDLRIQQQKHQLYSGKILGKNFSRFG
ncbi:uncharacterized protein LOC121404504 [Drosophila obscura]|uniref:uncharacterized protein LOC121404504 n=1 Tax=Drosophila obscura TaxID=7282 RepID=UPI001BB282F6|nr:uncharacterized protein LOC121404504 [Drosophila obscura]